MARNSSYLSSDPADHNMVNINPAIIFWLTGKSKTTTGSVLCTSNPGAPFTV